MLLYYLFWMFMGFIKHFYIIFGTNLLTEGPAQICCFMPILVFRGKGISDGVKTERNQLDVKKHAQRRYERWDDEDGHR